MRLIFFVLLILNLLAVASLNGWLGGPAQTGEPQRLTNQLYPERLRIVDDSAAETSSPSPVAETQIVEANPVNAVPPGEATPASVPTPPAPSTPPVTVSAPQTATPAPPAQVPSPAPTAQVAKPDACAVFASLPADQARNLIAAVKLREPGMRIDDRATESVRDWWVHVPPQGGRAEAEARAAELRLLGVQDIFIVRDAGPNQFAISLGVFKSEDSARRQLAELGAKGVKGARVVQRGTSTHRVELRGSGEAMPGLLSVLGRLDSSWRAQACGR